MASYLSQLFAAKLSYEAGISDLLAHGRSLEPLAPWALLDQVNWREEAQSFALWVRRNAPPPALTREIRGYYFALAGLGAGVHFHGTATFEVSAESRTVYRSSQAWTESQVLRVLPAFASFGVLPNLLALGVLGILIRKQVPDCGCASDSQKPVAVGFDFGDAYLVIAPSGHCAVA